MEDVELKLGSNGHGAFVIADNGTKVGEMEIAIAPAMLTVFHTEVVPEAEGKGIAKKLLAAMVAYAREHQLKVNPLCPYVHARFKRHPDEYADIWSI
jgi:predicted GNAT family acetyltransferase